MSRKGKKELSGIDLCSRIEAGVSASHIITEALSCCIIYTIESLIMLFVQVEEEFIKNTQS